MTGHRLLFASLFALLIAVPAAAHEEKAGELTISHPWSRATAPSQKAGAVFMEIHNSAGTADRLIGAASPDADRAEIHGHIRDGDIMRMRKVEGVEVPAGGSASLKPGGFHVMLMGLKGPLFEDTVIPLTLTFEKAGRFEIEVIVEAAGASGSGTMREKMGQDSHGGHGMKNR